MKAGGNRRAGAGAETIRALRSVMLATGGNAKVRELIQLLTPAEATAVLGVSAELRPTCDRPRRNPVRADREG
jgi:hypothetical protein